MNKIQPKKRWLKMSELEFSTVDISPKRRKKNKIKLSDLQRLSITINPDEISYLCDQTSHMTTMYNMASDTLFVQFQNVYQSLGSVQQVFDTISSFTEICSSTIKSISSGRDMTDRQGNDISWLVNEKNTWRLLYVLYKDRATYEEEIEPMSVEIEVPMSEMDIIKNFYKNNSSIREAQLLTDWLEQNARDEWDMIDKDDITHYMDKTVAWENTLFQIQNTSVAYKSSKSIVSHLDPDAPLRENKPLHDFDTEDEKRLLKQVFLEIRKGQIDEAQKRCIHCGQAWRAASLEGWRLFHDSNFASKNVNEKTPSVGNPQRGIWKLCAWKMCEDPRVSIEDKAIMGSLCGHLDSVIPHCTNWEDKLWAYTRVTIDIMVEREIRDNSLNDYMPLPAKYWSNLKSMDTIFNEVGNEEENRPDRIIQEMIILGRPADLLFKCAEWVEQECQPQFLRFLTHLVLTFRLLGYSSPEHLGDNVIKAYVKALLEERNIDSIAYYCSLLPEEDQIEHFASFMENVTDREERQECLAAAEKYEMNIPSITEKVVQSIRTRKQDITMDQSLLQETTQEDFKKISALDWMVFYQQQWAEALWECNALIREFIVLHKMSTARLAFNKMPPQATDVIKDQYKSESGNLEENLPPKVKSALKEYLCYKAYLDAQEGFNLWFEKFHNSKPVAPIKPVEKDFSSTVAYEQKQQKYEEDVKIWNEHMNLQTTGLRAQLHNVLMFPEGWLVDTLTDEEPRASHLQTLRKMCIPQIFALLFKVLDSMELHGDIIHLPSIIFHKNQNLYKLFLKQDLEEFLDKIANISVLMVQNQKDPFGGKLYKDDETVLPVITEGPLCVEKAKSGANFLKQFRRKTLSKKKREFNEYELKIMMKDNVVIKKRPSENMDEEEEDEYKDFTET